MSIQPRLPPGPRSRLSSTVRQANALAESLLAWERRYGPTFTVRDLLQTIVFTSEPELVREILTADPKIFGGAPAWGDVLFGLGSLGMIAGSRHRQQRKLLQPFFGRSAVESWGPTIAEITRRVFEGAGRGDVLEIRECMLEVTLRVIVRVIFGARDEVEEDELVVAASRWAKAIHPSFLLSRPLRRDLWGLLPYRRYRLAREALDGLLQAKIEACRRSKQRSNDLLSALTHASADAGEALDDDEIRDNLRLLLFAGHETTAYVLTWAMLLLHDHDHGHARLGVRRELAEVDEGAEPKALARLPYLRAVLHETLRLRSPSVFIVRTLVEPMQLGPWRLPAGVTIMPVPMLRHLDPNAWPDPERFEPERFLSGHPSPTDFLPFGGSHRRCPGGSFAMFEAPIILATVLGMYEFTSVASREVPYTRLGLVVGPGTRAPMTVSEVLDIAA